MHGQDAYPTRGSWYNVAVGGTPTCRAKGAAVTAALERSGGTHPVRSAPIPPRVHFEVRVLAEVLDRHEAAALAAEGQAFLGTAVGALAPSGRDECGQLLARGRRAAADEGRCRALRRGTGTTGRRPSTGYDRS